MARLGSADYPTEVNIEAISEHASTTYRTVKGPSRCLGRRSVLFSWRAASVNIAHASQEFYRLAEKDRGSGSFTIMGRSATSHPLYIGNLGMHGAVSFNMAVNECDLLFSIGTRFNDRITGSCIHLPPCPDRAY